MQEERWISKEKIIFLVIFIYFSIVHSTDFDFSLFKRDYKITRQVIERSDSESVILCISYCSDEVNCTAVSYRESTGECELVDLCLYFYIADNFSHSEWIVIEKAMDGICPGYTITDSMGGNGGFLFSEYFYSYNSVTASYRNITAMQVSCTTQVPYIRVQYGGTWAPERGDVRSGDVRNYTFDPGEIIVAVFGAISDRVASLQFNTNKRSLPQCGASDSLKLLSHGNDTDKLAYIGGREGWLLDKIEFYWVKI